MTARREWHANGGTWCRHCLRVIEYAGDGLWIDPAATGDDSIWRETCEDHDTFEASHEPDSVPAVRWPS